MVITNVSAQKKPGRYNIFIDKKYAFSVGEKTLAEFRLLPGSELDQEKIDEIQKYDINAKASDLAARYLSYQPRTIKEVRQYLQKQNVDDAAIKVAIDELDSLGYLDDTQYTDLFIKNDLQVGSDGPRSIKRKLQQKGVADDIINNQLQEITDEQWAELGYRIVKSMVSKEGKISQKELIQKIKTKLLSHGFDLAISDLVIDLLDIDVDEDAQLEALKVQGIKAYKRFKKYDGAVYKIKMTQYLLKHGFNSTEISSFLDGEVIPLSELEEY